MLLGSGGGGGSVGGNRVPLKCVTCDIWSSSYDYWLSHLTSDSHQEKIGNDLKFGHESWIENADCCLRVTEVKGVNIQPFVAYLSKFGTLMDLIKQQDERKMEFYYIKYDSPEPANNILTGQRKVPHQVQGRQIFFRRKYEPVSSSSNEQRTAIGLLTTEYWDNVNEGDGTALGLTTYNDDDDHENHEDHVNTDQDKETEVVLQLQKGIEVEVVTVEVEETNKTQNHEEEHDLFSNKMIQHLAGNLSDMCIEDQLEAFCKNILLSEPYLEARFKLVQELLTIIKVKYGKVTIFPYGFDYIGIGNSDDSVNVYIDLFDNVLSTQKQPGETNTAQHWSQVFQILKGEEDCQRFCFNVSKTADRISFKHIASDLKVNLRLSGYAVVQEAMLIKFFCSLDPRIRPLLALTRYWTAVNKIWDSIPENCDTRGRFSVLLMLFHLCNRNVIPTLAKLQSEPHENIIFEGVDLSFCSDKSKLPPPNTLLMEDKSIMTLSTMSLLKDFFERFGIANLKENAVSLWYGKFVKKDHLTPQNQHLLPDDFASKLLFAPDGEIRSQKFNVGNNKDHLFCVQDLFDHSLNIGLNIDANEMKKFQGTAWKTGEKLERVLNCDKPCIMNIFITSAEDEQIEQEQEIEKQKEFQEMHKQIQQEQQRLLQLKKEKELEERQRKVALEEEARRQRLRDEEEQIRRKKRQQEEEEKRRRQRERDDERQRLIKNEQEEQRRFVQRQQDEQRLQREREIQQRQKQNQWNNNQPPRQQQLRQNYSPAVAPPPPLFNNNDKRGSNSKNNNRASFGNSSSNPNLMPLGDRRQQPPAAAVATRNNFTTSSNNNQQQNNSGPSSYYPKPSFNNQSVNNRQDHAPKLPASDQGRVMRDPGRSLVPGTSYTLQHSSDGKSGGGKSMEHEDWLNTEWEEFSKSLELPTTSPPSSFLNFNQNRKPVVQVAPSQKSILRNPLPQYSDVAPPPPPPPVQPAFKYSQQQVHPYFGAGGGAPISGVAASKGPLRYDAGEDNKNQGKKRPSSELTDSEDSSSSSSDSDSDDDNEEEEEEEYEQDKSDPALSSERLINPYPVAKVSLCPFLKDLFVQAVEKNDFAYGIRGKLQTLFLQFMKEFNNRFWKKCFGFELELDPTYQDTTPADYAKFGDRKSTNIKTLLASVPCFEENYTTTFFCQSVGKLSTLLTHSQPNDLQRAKFIRKQSKHQIKILMEELPPHLVQTNQNLRFKVQVCVILDYKNLNKECQPYVQIIFDKGLSTQNEMLTLFRFFGKLYSKMSMKFISYCIKRWLASCVDFDLKATEKKCMLMRQEEIDSGKRLTRKQRRKLRRLKRAEKKKQKKAMEQQAKSWSASTLPSRNVVGLGSQAQNLDIGTGGGASVWSSRFATSGNNFANTTAATQPSSTLQPQSQYQQQFQNQPRMAGAQQQQQPEGSGSRGGRFITGRGRTFQVPPNWSRSVNNTNPSSSNMYNRRQF